MIPEFMNIGKTLCPHICALQFVMSISQMVLLDGIPESVICVGQGIIHVV